MKNLLKNRKGFTLAEILLVVAIVVILSGATVIGVASWVNQSKATAQQLTAKSADFEASAVKDVNEKKGTLGTNAVETESLETGSTETNNNGNNGGNGNNGNNSDSGNGNAIGGNGGNGGSGETTAASESSEETESKAAETTKAQEGTVTAANTSSNADGASVSVSGYWNGSNANMSFTIDKQVKEFTFWVPDEVVGGTISSNTGNCKYTYNGNFFTVTMTYGSTSGSGFSINAPNGHTFDPSKIVLYSYVPGSV